MSDAMAGNSLRRAWMRQMIHSWIAPMGKRPFKVTFASILVLTSASCRAEAGKADTAGISAEPAYGDTVALKGHYVTGEETSTFYPCDASREQCTAAPGHGEENCWVQFSENLHRQLSGKVAGYGPEGGRFWLEGTGRVSSRPGNFGHLGAYSCRIEISRIDVLDTRSPVQSGD